MALSSPLSILGLDSGPFSFYSTFGTLPKVFFRTLKSRFEKQYNEINNLSSQTDLNEFVEIKLHDLFSHAYEHNRYYHRIFKQIALVRDGEVDLSRILDIPILTKDIIRKNYPDLISDDYQTRKWFTIFRRLNGEPIRYRIMFSDKTAANLLL